MSKSAKKSSSAMVFIKSLIFVILVPGIVVFYIPYEIVASSLDIKFRIGSLRLTAVFPWLLGISAVLWCVWDFIFKGIGTPAPIDPPKKLVVAGLYQVVRNPMYVGVLLVLSGHVLWFQSFFLLLYAVGLFVVFHLWVVFYEEPALQKKFGDSYSSYLQKVPRWIPRKSGPS